MEQNEQSEIIYHRKILIDKSRSPEEKENSRKLLIKLLDQVEENMKSDFGKIKIMQMKEALK